jgi:hypothetical protein
MGGRVLNGMARQSSSEHVSRSRLISATPVAALQLNRLVQVVSGTFDYWFPNVFCTRGEPSIQRTVYRFVG